MKHIELTQDRLKELFDYDTSGYLIWRDNKGPRKVKGRVAGGDNGNGGYQGIKVDGRIYKTHRLIFFYHHGVMPDTIDHINRVKWDNRIENLRSASRSQQSINRPYKNTSGWRGVSWCFNIWRVRIKAGKKRVVVGKFNDLIEAAQAYNLAVWEHHGEFADYNFGGGPGVFD